MQSGKQMHESPEYDALIFRPAVSLPIRAGTGGKKKEKGRKKESRKRTGNEAVYNVFHLLLFPSLFRGRRQRRYRRYIAEDSSDH